jgi:hypothetical protein
MQSLSTHHVYHLAELTNWPSIQAHGLLCANRLVERAGVSKTQAQRLLAEQRNDHVVLPNGTAIRDQKPMPANALAKCLVGMTPSEWYSLINSKVFFWFDIERMNRQRKASGVREQIVLTINLQKLLASYADVAALSPINTGNARRVPATRGRATFVPYREWTETRWASEASALGTNERARSHEPVELTVPDALPDIADYITSTKRLKSNQFFDS